MIVCVFTCTPANGISSTIMFAVFKLRIPVSEAPGYVPKLPFNALLGGIIMSKNTYTAVVTTVYTVHAESEEDAIKSVRHTVTGGIFADNVFISSQSALLVDKERYDGSILDLSTMLLPPDTPLSAVTLFLLGNEQLG